MNYETLNECASCIQWKEDKPEHLCLNGKCYIDPSNITPRTRHFCCSCHKPIDERGSDGHN